MADAQILDTLDARRRGAARRVRRQRPNRRFRWIHIRAIAAGRSKIGKQHFADHAPVRAAAQDNRTVHALVFVLLQDDTARVDGRGGPQWSGTRRRPRRRPRRRTWWKRRRDRGRGAAVKTPLRSDNTSECRHRRIDSGHVEITCEIFARHARAQDDGTPASRIDRSSTSHRGRGFDPRQTVKVPRALRAEHDVILRTSSARGPHLPQRGCVLHYFVPKRWTSALDVDTERMRRQRAIPVLCLRDR